MNELAQQNGRAVAKVAIHPDGTLADPRDELYSRVYAQTFDREASFRAIGLNPGKRGNYADTGTNYLRWRPHIHDRVKVLVKERAESLCIDENWIVLKLVKALDRAMEAKEKTDGEGDGTGVFEFDGKTVTKTLEMLGSELGMFQRNKQKAQGGVTINMNFGGDTTPITIEDGKTIEADA